MICYIKKLYLYRSIIVVSVKNLIFFCGKFVKKENIARMIFWWGLHDDWAA